MSGEFLKKARAIQGDYEQTPSYREEKAKRFSIECWPEILAVVEATQWAFEQGLVDRFTLDGKVVSIRGRLDALDKKASEL